ncbi:MAG: DUF1013 domain-containing protein [Alphaproteobacteria bacterium]|nr:DUF1013 domain-containing protein [Alphaproteobacteria bacterium]
MTNPLMPKATAVWLVENTTLTFEQVAAFCNLHPLEVQAIADAEAAIGIVGLNPITNGQVAAEDIRLGEADPERRLALLKPEIEIKQRTKGPRYTPVAKRQDRPDAIAWMLRNYPEITDAQVGRLLGTTKATINAVRERTHWNSQNIRPRNPVDLGLCSQTELDAVIGRARIGLDKEPERGFVRIAREELEAAAEEAAAVADAGRPMDADRVFGTRKPG